MTKKSAINPWITFIGVLVILSLITAGAWQAISGKVTILGLSTSHLGNSTTLTVGTSQQLNSLDITSDTSQAVDQALLHNVYETLVNTDSKNQPVNTGLAHSWSVSDDNLTYTFKLRSGLHFSNGHTLNADDVVSSLQNTIEKQTADSSRLSRISDVHGKNLQVTIKLSQTDPNLLWSLSTRAGIVYDAQTQFDKKIMALGSGPYTVKKFVAGETLTLQANSRYWKNSIPGSSTVILRYEKDASTAVSDFASKKIDVLLPLTNSPSTTNLAQIRTDLSNVKGANITQTASTHRWAIVLNNSADSLFSDTHIRQAYRALTDKQSLISTLGISATPISGPISTLDPGYEDYNAQYPFDQAQAKKLLSFFGYSRNLTLAYPTRYGDTLANTLSQQLSALGGTVSAQAIPDDQWQSTVVEGKKFDLALVDLADSHDIETIASPDYLTSYSDETTENDLAAVKSAATSQDYEAAAKTLATRFADESYIIWLYEEQPIVAAHSGISGLPTSMADSSTDFSNIIKK